MLPQWGNEAQRLLQTSILDGLGVDPSQVHEQYTQLLAVRRDTGKSDAVKQQYWLYVSTAPTQPGRQRPSLPVQQPEQRIDGVTFQPSIKQIRIEE
jgi:hypothetical protein